LQPGTSPRFLWRITLQGRILAAFMVGPTGEDMFRVASTAEKLWHCLLRDLTGS
jgi:hypothetical protein